MMLSSKLASGYRMSQVQHKALTLKPIVPLTKTRLVAVRTRSGHHGIKAQLAAGEGTQERRGTQTIVVPTIFATSSDGQVLKANVFLPASKAGGSNIPQNGASISVKARGVVLFMHGFAQDPTAYARMLTLLTGDDVVVVAPCPPTDATAAKQQGDMVDCALFWRDLIASNQLPGLQLLGGTNVNVGFLGHSVGGGLSAYVVNAAAQNGQAFTCAHVMAPQTSLVVPAYNYADVDGGNMLQGVATEWYVQFGLLDLLAFAWDVEGYCKWLQAKGKLTGTVKYDFGSHIGFEDQLVAGNESFSYNVLPWLVAAFSGILALVLPAATLRALTLLRRDDKLRKAEAPGGQAQSKAKGTTPQTTSGFGTPDTIELPDERLMWAGYILLAASVTAVEQALPGFSWGWSLDSLGSDTVSVIKGIFLILTVFAWPAVAVYPYEAWRQRPESRRKVVEYFKASLVPAKNTPQTPTPVPAK